MRDYYEEMSKNNSECQSMEDEYIYAFCCAMVCGKMGN